MDNFELLGQLALRLHNEFRQLYYLLLPIFFSISLVFAWFREPRGGPDFVDSLKRAFVATLLLAGFQEISDTILQVANGLSGKISDMSGLDSLLKMAGDKAHSYTLSTTSLILGFNDLLIAVLSFLSYLILYVARYIMVALYHFTWVFLSIMAPFLLLFHLFTSKITANLFKSLIEVASWQIVWAVLSAMLSALPFGNAYVADGNYLTVIVINFVIALCMLGTPLVVHSLVGSGFSAMSSTLSPVVAATMIAVPAKAATVTNLGRQILGDTAGYLQHQSSRIGGAYYNHLMAKSAGKPTIPAPTEASAQTPSTTPPPPQSPKKP